MDYFDKKINELYNRPEEDVPSDLSWDNMEDGIYSRMDDKKPRRKFLWYWISGGLIAIALVVVSFMMFNKEENNSKFANNNNTKNTQNNSSKSITPSFTKISHIEPVSITNKYSETKTTPIGEGQNDSNKETKVINQISALSENETSFRKRSDNNRSTDAVYTITKSSGDHNISILTNTASTIESNLAVDNAKEINVSKSFIEESRAPFIIDILTSIIPSTLDTEREVLKSNIQKITNDTHPREIENRRNTKYSFSILGGASLHSGFNVLNNNHTSSLPGYSTRLGLSAEKESGWGYDLGISYALLVEKFDFEKTDTIIELHEGIVISRLTNSLTGNTTDLIGNAYRDGSRHRRELIYNNINLISVDASIYRNINISKKWSLGPSFGIQYDRILSIKGKSLDTAGEVFSYDNTTKDINKNLLSAKLGVGIDYAMTNSLSISAKASSALSFNNLYSDSKRLTINYLRGGIKIKL